MKRIGIIFLVIFLVLLNFYQCSKNKQEIKEYENLITAIQDTLIFTQKENGTYLSTISVLTAENGQTFLKMKSKDKEIQELQNAVKQYKNKIQTLTQFTSQLKFDTIVNTVVKYQDTFPTYYFSFKDEWIDLRGNSNKNNTQLSLQTTEKYDVAIYEEKKQIRIDILNRNPYSKTTGIQSFYKTKPKQKRIGVGPYIGYGYGINQKFGFEVGIGITYNLFYLW